MWSCSAPDLIALSYRTNRVTFASDEKPLYAHFFNE